MMNRDHNADVARLFSIEARALRVIHDGDMHRADPIQWAEDTLWLLTLANEQWSALTDQHGSSADPASDQPPRQ